MARVINTLTDAISYINTNYELDSTAPSSGEEDFTVWTGLLNTAINLWETEEGVLWKELFVKLADAATGDKTTAAGDYSYACPTDFIFSASGYVWVGTGTNKTAYKVVSVNDIQLYENDSSNWCYFIGGASPTLNFNPNITIPASKTISYNYYKYATKLASGSDVFEMSDPMFAVYYAIGILKQEEGDTSALQVATQKLEAMKTKNTMPTWYQDDNSLTNDLDDGMGVE